MCCRQIGGWPIEKTEGGADCAAIGKAGNSASVPNKALVCNVQVMAGCKSKLCAPCCRHRATSGRRFRPAQCDVAVTPNEADGVADGDRVSAGVSRSGCGYPT